MTDEADEHYAQLVLIMGPYAGAGDLGAIGSSGETLNEALRARVRRIDAATERETVQALRTPCEAIVLDPGSTEHFSVSIADSIARLEVPVIVVRGQQEPESTITAPPHCVAPAARASVSGGGAAAYEAAVEAAAWFAWEARRETHAGDEVASLRISEPG